MKRVRGAILLEILISLALFVTAGSIILVSTTSMSAALVRTRDRQIANDLAVSKMGELEAGLITAEQLNDSVIDVSLFSVREAARSAGSSAAPQRWRIAVETEPSRFTPLTNVTIRVLDTQGRRAGAEQELAVLHQLLRLDSQSSDEFETDPLLDGFGSLEGEGASG